MADNESTTLTVEPDTGGDPNPVDSGDSGDSLILGKFKTQQELEKAYQELEKKQSGATTEPAETPKVEPVKQVDLIDQAAQEFASSGSLSDKMYEQLKEQKGLSRNYVDTYIAGLQASSASRETALNDAFKDIPIDQFNQWAGTELSDAEINTYNTTLEAVRSGTMDPTTGKTIMDGFAARFRVANPTVVHTGQASPDSSAAPFATKRDWINATKDPRYSSSDEYRLQVEARFEASKRTGAF